jgi:hypothetical protein
MYILFPDLSKSFLKDGGKIRDFNDGYKYMIEKFDNIKHDFNRNILYDNISKIRLYRIDFHSRIRPTEEIREFFTDSFRENLDKLSKYLPNVKSITSRKKSEDGIYFPVYINYDHKTGLLYDELRHPRKEDFLKFEIRYRGARRLKTLFDTYDIDDLQLLNLIDYPVEKLEEYFYSDLDGFIENFNLAKKSVGKSYTKAIGNMESVLYGTPFNGIRDFTRLYNKLEKEEKKKRTLSKNVELRMVVLEKFPEIDKDIKEWLIKDRPDIAGTPHNQERCPLH